ncbi:sensor histidine kinase [Actinacidiphila bryophytorum]|uniref:sensor histidine kinase n=1 Tax=Actinacidiphila bryophytorum TaxID=1436133 RepID=UPI002176ADE2|nr:ATP-binding protein [Actinacidiphila bryophytorum]UWE10340.1 ATP-binding protein [Actinacidiphila bryophytorum]
MYGALFLVSGIALLVITYLLVRTSSSLRLYVQHSQAGSSVSPTDPGLLAQAPLMHQAERRASQQRTTMLHTLLTQSGIALALMSAVSIALGWVMAGRALRPVRAMTDKARRISARNLHERLAVPGPDDELKDLGDTIDDLLGRLDTAFAAQRRFVANASHELRTPLTLQRAMIEVALTDPKADATTLRAVCERVLATGEHQETMIEALLTLARSERGLEHRTPLDLAGIAGAALPEGAPGGMRIGHSLDPATATGDPRLIERMVTNLVDNAVRHNVPGGWVEVSTRTQDTRPVLRVVNSGRHIPDDRIGELFQPFQRLESRSGTSDGHGLGLSIVAAIATAHDADVTARPGPAGGLDVTVAFAGSPGGS